MNRFVIALSFLAPVALRADEPRRDRFGDPLPPGAVARLGTINAHPNASTVAFSADGRTIITTSGTAVRHWDAESGRVRRTVVLPGDAVNARRVVSADGRIVATLVEDGLEIHDMERDCPLHRMKIDNREELARVRRLGEGMFRISPRGDIVLIRFEDARDLLVVRDGKLETWAGVEGGTYETIFSVNGKSVALRAKRYDPRTSFRGTAAGSLAVKLTGFVHAIAADGSRLAVEADDEDLEHPKVALIDAQTGQAIAGAEFAVGSAPRAACFNADGRLLAVATDMEVTVWDIATKKRRWRAAGRASHLTFSPDGRRLAGIEHLLTVWDVGTGKAVTPDFGPLPNHVVSEEPRNNRIVIRNYSTGHFQVWDWTTARVCFSTEFERHNHSTGGWLSADGARLYLCAERKAQAWDIANGKLLCEFNPTPPDLDKEPWEMSGTASHGAELSVLLVDGSAGQKKTRCVFVRWDGDSGKQLYRRALELPPSDAIRLTQDAWGISTSNVRESDHMFDARTGRERPPAYQPGRRLQVGYSQSDGMPAERVVVETASRKRILQLPGPFRVTEDFYGDAITPDGRWVALARPTGIELWDVIEQRKIPFHPPYSPRDGHPLDSVQMSFLSNDRLLVCYTDMSMLVWELPAVTRGLPSARISPTTWEQLGDDRPLVAQRAVWALKRDPEAGIELLRRGKRVEPPDAKTLAALWANLGDRDFSKREAATKALRALGQPAATFLTAALAKDTNVEQRRRAKLVLDDIGENPPNPDELRAVRCVQAAELIGNDAAKALLADWAEGDENAVLTREAKAALQRGNSK